MANLNGDNLEFHHDADGSESDKLLGDETVRLELSSTTSKGNNEEEKNDYEVNSMELRTQDNGNVQFILVDSELSSEDEARDELVEITEADIEKASMTVLVDHGEFPDYDPHARKHFEEWILVDVNQKNYKVTENLLQVSSVYSGNDRLCCVIQ